MYRMQHSMVFFHFFPESLGPGPLFKNKVTGMLQIQLWTALKHQSVGKSLLDKFHIEAGRGILSTISNHSRWQDLQG